MRGEIVSINISTMKGTRKVPVQEATINELGLEGDAHAGKWHRQVSLLAKESIIKARNWGLDVSNGDFAENITTRGLTLHKLKVGTKLIINDVILEVSQIGKKRHEDCEIKRLTGKCIMPIEGVFAKVIQGGKIKVGDSIQVLVEK